MLGKQGLQYLGTTVEFGWLVVCFRIFGCNESFVDGEVVATRARHIWVIEINPHSLINLDYLPIQRLEIPMPSNIGNQ